MWRNHSEMDKNMWSSSMATVSAVMIVCIKDTVITWPSLPSRWMKIHFLNQHASNTTKRCCKKSYCTHSCLKTVLSYCCKKEETCQIVHQSLPSYLKFLHIFYYLYLIPPMCRTNLLCTGALVLFDTANKIEISSHQSFKLASATMLPN